MSWSVSYLGTPSGIVKALRDQSEKMTDQSKVEFDAALPHLIALVEQNFGDGDNFACPVVDFEANGHGMSRNGEQVQRFCSVTIKPNYRTIV